MAVGLHFAKPHVKHYQHASEIIGLPSSKTHELCHDKFVKLVKKMEMTVSTHPFLDFCEAFGVAIDLECVSGEVLGGNFTKPFCAKKFL